MGEEAYPQFRTFQNLTDFKTKCDTERAAGKTCDVQAFGKILRENKTGRCPETIVADLLDFLGEKIDFEGLTGLALSGKLYKKFPFIYQKGLSHQRPICYNKLVGSPFDEKTVNSLRAFNLGAAQKVSDKELPGFTTPQDEYQKKLDDVRLGKPLKPHFHHLPIKDERGWNLDNKKKVYNALLKDSPELAKALKGRLNANPRPAKRKNPTKGTTAGKPKKPKAAKGSSPKKGAAARGPQPYTTKPATPPKKRSASHKEL